MSVKVVEVKRFWHANNNNTIKKYMSLIFFSLPTLMRQIFVTIQLRRNTFVSGKFWHYSAVLNVEVKGKGVEMQQMPQHSFSFVKIHQHVIFFPLQYTKAPPTHLLPRRSLQAIALVFYQPCVWTHSRTFIFSQWTINSTDNLNVHLHSLMTPKTRNLFTFSFLAENQSKYDSYPERWDNFTSTNPTLPSKERQLQILMLLPPCFTVVMAFLSWCMSHAQCLRMLQPALTVFFGNERLLVLNTISNYEHRTMLSQLNLSQCIQKVLQLSQCRCRPLASLLYQFVFL